jgi:molybdopterin converting factor subunit 1
MKVTVLLFASLKDAAKTSQIELDLPEGAKVETAIEVLATRFPEIKQWLPHTRLAVAQEYTDKNTVLKEGDELALIPPVSGGDFQPHIEVVETEIALEPLIEIVQNQIGGKAGAICSFLGVVRDHSKDLEGVLHDDIEFLEYEAYAAMAIKQMEKIALEAFEKWGAVVAMTHRTGKLGIGEASVAIVAATPHRGESFEACRYAIEELKQRVPVWKKETAKSGVWWVESSGQNK